jgi:hypothetical protein
MASQGSRGGADNGDANLNGCQKTLGLVSERENRAGIPSPFVGELLQPGLSNPNDGDLGTSEERVGENQGQDDD